MLTTRNRAICLSLVLISIAATAVFAQEAPSASEIFDRYLMRFEAESAFSQGIMLDGTLYPMTNRGFRQLEVPMARYSEPEQAFRTSRRMRASGLVLALGGSMLVGIAGATIELDMPVISISAAIVGTGTYIIGIVNSGRSAQYLYSAVNSYNRNRLAEILE